MRMGTMLADVLRSLLRRPSTERYPFERRSAPPRLRGALRFDPQACTGCALCVMDCPALAIELLTVDKAAKRFALRYHVDRCTFCAQCVQSCKHGCLSLDSEQWELAARDLEPFARDLGNEPDGKPDLADGTGAEPAAAANQ